MFIHLKQDYLIIAKQKINKYLGLMYSFYCKFKISNHPGRHMIRVNFGPINQQYFIYLKFVFFLS